jgi:predicted HTH transcriptional regulator
MKKFNGNPSFPIEQYRSDNVLYSALKTIDAFLNCGGGVLFLGVNDDGTINGLHRDCKILKHEEFNPDIFQLEIRNQVTGKFKEGLSINDYLDINIFLDQGLSFARLKVQGRKKSSYIIQDNLCRLYKRQGNRSVEVKIEDAEEFFYYRVCQGWA